MARMIPEAYPTDTESTAERKLFTAIKGGLDDAFTVIHSLPWLDGSLRYLQQGECDFVVLHPLYGMLAVETKAGEAHYDATNRTWYRQDGGRMNKDPFLQAQQSLHYLSRLLHRDVRGWSHVQPPFGYAVVFPEADKIIGRFPPHVDPKLVILGRQLENLQAKIVTVLAQFGTPQTRMTRDLYDRAILRLLPEFQVVRTLSSQIDDQRSALARMTDQQIQLMESMRRNRRLLVEGCAGSGKTLLAFEKAVRLANEGARVLLLCFNIPLANWLRDRAQAQASNHPIDVFHFHGLCEHVVTAGGGDFHTPDADSSADVMKQFYDVDCADKLEQFVPGYPNRYDAIIVDEGQDFVDCWWIPIENILAEPGQGSLYIFYDPEQNLFNRDNGFPMPGPTMVLDVNCRNTHEIAAYVHQLVGSKARLAGFRSEGFAPVEHRVMSDTEELDEVSKILDELVRVEHMAPDQIVIIGRRRFENSPYAQVSRLGGVEIVNEADSHVNHGGVRYATIYRFKGLEADCAILTGFRHPTVDQRSRELYVATSRARSLLHVMYRE
ncbi:MAG: NERD domain-containing protein [Thermoguttaceae bacterium]|nr:NERD domain-containing protein [Thermoguttaceae bacterium]